MYQSSKGIRVLIALRDATRLNSYNEALVREGFKVTAVGNALACWAELECQRPDVLVLERELPWGGGDGVLAMLDEEPDVRNIPVILFSNEGDFAGFSGGALRSNRVSLSSSPRPTELVQAIRRLNAAANLADHHRSLMRRPLELQAVGEDAA